MKPKFKIYKILDSTSSATYWSFINEEQENDDFIECIKEKEVTIEELKEMFMFEDDLGQSVLFESLLELVQTSEELAVEKFKEELKDKINKILNKFAKTTDIDGRETLYKYTDCDLADLRAEILELIDK